MLIRPSASPAAWRRRVGVAGAVVLVGTLLIAAGATAQQQGDPLTINDPSATESAGTLTFRVTNTAPIDTNAYPSGVEVDYFTSDGSARSGPGHRDYTHTTGTLTFTAVNQTFSVTVPILDDTLNEADETFRLRLDDPRAPNAFMSGTGTIRDDDARPQLCLGGFAPGVDRSDLCAQVAAAGTSDAKAEIRKVWPRNEVMSESGINMRFNVALSEPSGRRVTVRYEVVPGLKRNSSGALIDSSDCGLATENDVCKEATPRDDYRADGGQSFTTKQGEGHETLVGEVVIEAGKTEPNLPITVRVVDDSAADPTDRDETFTLRVIRATPDPTFDFATPGDETAEGLILDNDLPRISITQWGAGAEGDVEVSWGIGVHPAPAGTVTVKYRTVHRENRETNTGDIIGIPGEYSSLDEGEALCAAEPGTDTDQDGDYDTGDYIPVSGTITFGPTNTFERVTTRKLDDVFQEATERICLELYEPSNGAHLELEPIWYSVIYDDNDVVQAFSVESASASESAGHLTFTVRIGTPPNSPEELTYRTVDGSAEAGKDYTSTQGTLLFLPGGSTTQTVSVPIINDSLHEENETFTLQVSGERNFSLTSGTGTILDDDSAPRLSVAPASADEDAADGRIDFTVTLSGASSRAVKVNYATEVATGDTATEGSSCNTAGVDYTATSGFLEFPPADQPGSQTISVPICDDTLYEGNETFTLTLSSPSNADFAGQATAISATGTIRENESEPSLSVDDVTGMESDGSLEFEVTLGAQSDTEVRVSYETEQLTGANRATGGASCAAGVDYLGVSPAVELVFPPGQVTQSVFVSLCSDSLDEEDETFRFKLSGAVGVPITRNEGTATGTIEDSDDAPELYVTDASSVAEDAGPAEFTVTLAEASAKTVTVRYATTDGSAVGGSSCSGRDYRSTSGTLTFRPGEALARDVEVPICDDSLDEEDSETFRLLLSSPSNAALRSGGDGATGTINDNDDLPLLSISGGSAREDATALNANNGVVFTVQLDAVSGRDVSVDYRTFKDTGDTAESGSDYTDTSGSLTIDAGRRSATVTVPVLNDTLAEDAETFTMELTNPTNAEFTGQAGFVSAKGTITDDNDPAVDLQIQNVTINEGGTATFTVTLAAVSGQEVTVNWETVDGTAIGDADCNGDGDFTESSGTLTFQAGNTAPDEADPAVVTCEDDLHEPAETFGLRLRTPTNATAPADPATGLINDNDGPPHLSVDEPRALEGAGKVTFTVTLDRVSGKDVTVKYATADGTAEAGRDYTARSGSLTIPAGETSETVDVPVSNDTTSEPEEETFTLVLSDPQNATGDGASGTATIVDDDGDPSFSVSDATAAEGSTDGVLTFTVRLSAASDQEATVGYATSGGTATSGTDCAVSGDFEETSGTLTFSPGDPLTQTVSVPICDDSLFESDEAFTLTLSNAVNAVVGGPTATATGMITDNERRPSLSIGNANVAEDDSAGIAQLTVTLDPTHSEQVTVNYATADGTATGGADCITDGVDYVAIPTTELVFAPSEATKTIDVEICNDDVHEDLVEKFSVRLSGPQNAALPNSGSTGEVQITDDEDPPTLSFQSGSDDVTVDEGDGTIAFVVELAGSSDKTVTVRYATANGSATSPADFTAPPSNATLSFAPDFALSQTMTITLDVEDDSLDEDDETFTLTLNDPSNAETRRRGRHRQDHRQRRPPGAVGRRRDGAGEHHREQRQQRPGVHHQPEGQPGQQRRERARRVRRLRDAVGDGGQPGDGRRGLHGDLRNLAHPRRPAFGDGHGADPGRRPRRERRDVHAAVEQRAERHPGHQRRRRHRHGHDHRQRRGRRVGNPERPIDRGHRHHVHGDPRPGEERAGGGELFDLERLGDRRRGLHGRRRLCPDIRDPDVRGTGGVTDVHGGNLPGPDRRTRRRDLQSPTDLLRRRGADLLCLRHHRRRRRLAAVVGQRSGSGGRGQSRYERAGRQQGCFRGDAQPGQRPDGHRGLRNRGWQRDAGRGLQREVGDADIRAGRTRDTDRRGHVHQGPDRRGRRDLHAGVERRGSGPDQRRLGRGHHHRRRRRAGPVGDQSRAGLGERRHRDLHGDAVAGEQQARDNQLHDIGSNRQDP